MRGASPLPGRVRRSTLPREDGGPRARPPRGGRRRSSSGKAGWGGWDVGTAAHWFGLVVVLSACPAPPGEGDRGEPDVVARIGSRKLTRLDVTRGIAMELYRREVDNYTLVKRELERRIEDTLIDDEASRRGLSPSALLDQEVARRTVSDEAFEANVRAGLDELRAGLPNGATVYVMAIVDIYRLWQIGQDLKALGLIDCEVVWLATLFDIYPCATMLSPANSEADRQFTRGRIIAFNGILEDLVAEYEQADSHHHYAFTNVSFQYQFAPSQVSGFDCFHPSADGQRELSRVTWEAGPFSP